MNTVKPNTVKPDPSALSTGKLRFPWKREYEVGDAHIDGQHRQLVELANLLYDAVVSGHGAAVVHPAFEALGLYTRKHFQDEEHFFEENGSSRLIEHRWQHEILAKELGALHDEEMLGFVDGVPDALERWVETRLVPHMIEDDQKAFHACTQAPARTGAA